MKRLIYFAAVLTGIPMAVGCDAVDPLPSAAPSAKLLIAETIPWTGSDGFTVSISATVPVVADAPQAEWLTYYGMEMTSRSNGTYVLIFEAAANPDKTERADTVCIRSKDEGKVLLSFALTQEAAQDPSIKLGEAGIFAYTGGEMSISVSSNVPFTLTSSEDWLSGAVSENGVTLTAEPNDSVGERSAELAFLYLGEQLASITIHQKGRPGEGIELERIWGRYTASDNDWFEQSGLGAADSERFIAMDDENIYISRIANNNPGETWGISVFDRSTGNYKKRLSDGAGIEKTGLWALSAMQAVDDGEGGSVLIACNMSRSQENNILKIYAWKNIDAAPQVVTYSYAKDHSASRFGDKMGVSGNWKKGELYFVDYFPTGNNRPMLIFPITDGIISSTPIDTQFASLLTGSSNIATIGALDGNSYIYYGSSNDAGFYCCTVTRKDDGFSEPVLRFMPSAGFDGIMNGLRTLTIADKSYLLWVTITRSDDKTARPSYVKTLPLEGESLSEGLAKLRNVSEAQVYPLAGTAVSAAMGRQNGNYTGDLAAWKAGDDWYVAALGTGSGVSLFKIKVL